MFEINGQDFIDCISYGSFVQAYYIPSVLVDKVQIYKLRSGGYNCVLVDEKGNQKEWRQFNNDVLVAKKIKEKFDF